MILKRIARNSIPTSPSLFVFELSYLIYVVFYFTQFNYSRLNNDLLLQPADAALPAHIKLERADAPGKPRTQ
jgi:hypothetical protein